MARKLKVSLDKFWITRDLESPASHDEIFLWFGGPPKETITTAGRTEYDADRTHTTSFIDNWAIDSDAYDFLLAVLNLPEIPHGSILEFSVTIERPETLRDQVNRAIRSKSVKVKDRVLRKVSNEVKL